MPGNLLSTLFQGHFNVNLKMTARRIWILLKKFEKGKSGRNETPWAQVKV